MNDRVEEVSTGNATAGVSASLSAENMVSIVP